MTRYRCKHAVAHTEYGIAMVRDHSVHRFGMTRADAETWLKKWTEMGGVEGVFRLISREVSAWIDETGVGGYR